MKIVGIILGSVGFICLLGVMYLGMASPETYIYTGKQVPKKYLSTINELNVLKADEEIKYFYSDALLDIKDGFYLVTDKSLVIYSNEWEEPTTIIPLSEITVLTPKYDDSFFEDSMIFVETDTLEMAFPLSSEKGLDKKFVAAIREKMQVVENPDLQEPQN